MTMLVMYGSLYPPCEYFLQELSAPALSPMHRADEQVKDLQLVRHEPSQATPNNLMLVLSH